MTVLGHCVAALILASTAVGCASSGAPSSSSAATGGRAQPHGTYSLDDKGCIHEVNAAADVYCPLSDGATWPSGGGAVAVASVHGADVIVSITASGKLREVKHGVATVFGSSVAVFATPDPDLQLRVEERRGTFVCGFDRALYPALPVLECDKAP